MTGALVALVERFTRDLDPYAAVVWEHPPGWVEAGLVLDGENVCAAGVPDDAPAGAGAIQILNVFQDAVIERAGGRAIPPCPGHPHPAVLRETEEGLGWRCPAADRPVAH